MKSYFITGVDTDIGKTFVSIGLCLAIENNNKKVGYYKPLQSGAFIEGSALKAPDLEELKKYSSTKSMYSYLLNGEVSPYLASINDGVEIDCNKIKNDFINFSSEFDYTIVEGAGGLYCPVAKNKLFSDIIKLLDIETIIVTTPKLGRLNHTLMTLELAKLHGIKIKGLIINKISDNQTESEKNFIKELKDFSDIEILALIPEIKNPNKHRIIEAFNGLIDNI